MRSDTSDRAPPAPAAAHRAGPGGGGCGRRRGAPRSGRPRHRFSSMSASREPASDGGAERTGAEGARLPAGSVEFGNFPRALGSASSKWTTARRGASLRFRAREPSGRVHGRGPGSGPSKRSRRRFGGGRHPRRTAMPHRARTGASSRASSRRTGGAGWTGRRPPRVGPSRRRGSGRRTGSDGRSRSARRRCRPEACRRRPSGSRAGGAGAGRHAGNPGRAGARPRAPRRPLRNGPPHGPREHPGDRTGGGPRRAMPAGRAPRRSARPGRRSVPPASAATAALTGRPAPSAARTVVCGPSSVSPWPCPSRPDPRIDPLEVDDPSTLFR